MNIKTKKQQVEGKEMLIATCKTKMHQNKSKTVEEKKLIVKKNAIKS